jgi:hypothetical protein
MGAVTIQHVKVGELPEAWQKQLGAAADTRVTVRIEAEVADEGDSAFGMWSDRAELSDVDAHLRTVRSERWHSS